MAKLHLGHIVGRSVREWSWYQRGPVAPDLAQRHRVSKTTPNAGLVDESRREAYRDVMCLDGTLQRRHICGIAVPEGLTGARKIHLRCSIHVAYDYAVLVMLYGKWSWQEDEQVVRDDEHNVLSIIRFWSSSVLCTKIDAYSSHYHSLALRLPVCGEGVGSKPCGLVAIVYAYMRATDESRRGGAHQRLACGEREVSTW